MVVEFPNPAFVVRAYLPSQHRKRIMDESSNMNHQGRDCVKYRESLGSSKLFSLKTTEC